MRDAFLIHDETIFKPDLTKISEKIHTPLTALIEGVWEEYPTQALSILRERIFTNYPPTSLCKGMLKVAAKRVSHLEKPEFISKQKLVTSETRWVKPKVHIQSPLYASRIGKPFSTDEKISLLTALERESTQAPERYYSDRAVGAALFDEDNRLLTYSWNTNAVHKTEHAELKLAQAWALNSQSRFPNHSSVWVSLKPCVMCATQLFQAFFHSSPKSEIVYLKDDPGPFSNYSFIESDPTFPKIIPFLKR